MPGNGNDELSAETIRDYMKMYHATMKLLSNSAVLFDSLSRTSPDAADRELYRAKTLDINRAIDLLSSKLEAFLEGTSPIRPPTHEELLKAQGLADKLSELALQNAQAEAMIELVTDAVAQFNKVSVDKVNAPVA